MRGRKTYNLGDIPLSQKFYIWLSYPYLAYSIYARWTRGWLAKDLAEPSPFCRASNPELGRSSNVRGEICVQVRCLRGHLPTWPKQNYEGHRLILYGDIFACDTCWQKNQDGWTPYYEKILLAHLERQGLQVPKRSAKGLLPRD